MYVTVSGNLQQQNNPATDAAEAGTMAPHTDSKNIAQCFSQTEQKLFNVQTTAVPALGALNPAARLH